MTSVMHRQAPLHSLLTSLSAATALASPAGAQQAGADRPILVIGERPLFGVPPERTLGEEDISSYGTGTIGELINEVTTENGESPDEPVIMVNGKVVGDLSDIADFPPEVVSQVQVLPRGAGTRVGASADRRVYNIVLKRNATAKVGRAAWRAATEGGSSAERADLTLTNVKGERRINAVARIRHQDELLENDRDIVQPAGSPPALGRFRTLLPSTDNYEFGLSAADQLAPWLTGSLNGKLVASRSHGLLGVNLAGGPLRRHAEGLTGNLDFTLNAQRGDWLLTLLGNYEYDRRQSDTDRLAGTSRTISRVTTANTDFTASGPLFHLPAGPLILTAGAAFARDAVSGSHRFETDVGNDRFVQWSESLNGGLEIPIASRREQVLPALGDLTATLQFTRTHVSHLGSLSNETFSLAWQPAAWLRVFGSLSTGRTPPQVSLLADPLLETPGVRYLDPLTGETVTVTQISGGNPDLEDQRVANRRLSANIRPFKSFPLLLTGEYSAVRNRDIITALPPASDLILLAFPDRFIRDPAGELAVVDIRPVQFAELNQDQLRYGLNLNLPLGHRVPAKASTEPDRKGAEASGEEGDDPRPSARPRLQFNLSHVWLLRSDLVLRPGIDPVDLLSKGAIGIGGASRPRHQLDLSLGYAERGLGIRLTGQYRSVSYLSLAGAAGTDALRFSPLATFSARGWLEGGRFAPGSPFLKGSRISLAVANITDRRQKVTDSMGLIPLAYQPGYRDPLGRTFEIELRKVF